MPKLVRRELSNGRTVMYFYCPACKHGHAFCIAGEGVPGNWAFNGNMDKPTFNPSLRVFFHRTETSEQVTLCHLVLTDGVIEFCGDCPHALAGQKVPMIEFPEGYNI